MSVPDARRITDGPNHYFFGYYDLNAWDAGGRFHLCLEVPFMDRPPTADDEAAVCMIDTESGELIRLDRTRAWNLQQACFLQWRPSAPDREIVFNDRRRGEFVCVVRDVKTGKSHVAGPAIGALSRSGKLGLALNFARLATHRPGYGYEGLADPVAHVAQPDDNGVSLVDLETGKSDLVLSVRRACEFADSPHRLMWLNHVNFNTDDERFVVLLRYLNDAGDRLITTMLTADPDGSDLRCLARETVVSHYNWKDANEILAFADGDQGWAFYVFHDGSDRIEHVNGLPDEDGHCSYSVDRRWILNDTYPDEAGNRRLMVFRIAEDRLVELGKYFCPHTDPISCRCDLHPRWSPDGRMISFDSIHEGARRIYVMDLGDIVGTP